MFAAPIFILSIVLANWLTTRYGFVPVGFGLTATAGTYAAGMALVARDFTQQALGKLWTIALILIGCVLSFILADARIAIASATAFLLSELVDMAIYTPLRERRWAAAVIASSIGGAVVDTALFIGIAFGAAALTWPVMAGQLVGKVLWVAIPVALIGSIARGRTSGISREA